ncbi:lytic transglycosylase domain-containing protein [Parabacteroides bouchesdurhonensis]|uniref:lytic transglycosylase domain-containing protein n=1 Tax=Parabacteroides bouchesdurhonensis TaxID=1936995 RepID=UPI000C84A38E|nr:lytic transglycosylase domain-containing protein [Parabacteroides bouchesdurhonensis]
MRKHLLTTLLCLVCSFVGVKAQEDAIGEQYSSLSADSIVAEVGLIPESLDANVDSLFRTWHVQYFSKIDEYCHDDVENVYFPDSIYVQRLERLPRIISLPYNKVVRDCIDLYAGRRRDLVRYMLGMADFYFPIIEQILDKHGLPLELKYLAVVESALNPVALSRVGACGLWQFMLPTGKSYGLEINSLVDERRDPLKATEAACQYFKDMYAIYGDWNLVLAAYNCGPGNVNKAIRRSGGKNNFWDIFPYLPRETRSYVPLFIAANYIMNYYCDHNICPMQTNLPLATDTVMVNNMLHLQQVAELLHLDIEQLRALNPQYKRDIIPGNAKPSVLKLPAAETYAFVGKEDTVHLYRAEELLANCIPLNAADRAMSHTATKEKITHVVASGENLYTIANRYGVTAKDIRKWNGLKSNRVPRGKRLKLYVDNGGVSFASNQSAKDKEKQPVTTAQTISKENPGDVKTADEKTAGKNFISYKVKPGDSLYSISKKYPGVTTSLLQKANGLTGTGLRPGQVLKIPVG